MAFNLTFRDIYQRGLYMGAGQVPTNKSRGHQSSETAYQLRACAAMSSTSYSRASQLRIPLCFTSNVFIPCSIHFSRQIRRSGTNHSDASCSKEQHYSLHQQECNKLRCSDKPPFRRVSLRWYTLSTAPSVKSCFLIFRFNHYSGVYTIAK